MLRRLTDLIQRNRHRFDLGVLLFSVVLTVGLYVLITTIDEVVEGDTEFVDRHIVLWVKHLDAPNWFNEIMRDCTAFGGIFVLTMTTGAVSLYFIARRLWNALVFLLTSVIGAWAISMALKGFFHRARPDIIEHGSYVFTTSFPSGHAMLSSATWLTLGVMLARLEKPVYLKAYFILIGVFISLMTGISRVWLGVHWPTDVLAGWAGGTVWATLSWFLARYLQHRGKIERSIEEPVKVADEPSDEVSALV